MSLLNKPLSWILQFAVVINLLVFSPCFAKDKIIAIVNSDVITQKDLSEFINFMRMQLSQELKGEQLENRIQSMKLDLLQKLVEDRLILQEAKRSSIKIDENRVQARIDEIRKRYNSDAQFQIAIGRQGLTQADLEQKIREQFLMYSLIDEKIRTKIKISPGEVTEFYKDNPEQFVLPQQREFDVMIIKDETLAKDTSDKIKGGQDFYELAKNYSLAVDKFSAMEDNRLRKDIADIVFKLKIGEVSASIKVENSFYIFKLTNIIPSRKQNLSEAQDKIYMFLFDKRMQEELTKWLGEIREHSYINILQ